jgi:diketogulonate reductase-like aldo/keto reductase
MIMFHPNSQAEMGPLMELMNANEVVIGAYSCLKPLWDGSNAVLGSVLSSIASDYGVTVDQVLLSWTHSRG